MQGSEHDTSDVRFRIQGAGTVPWSDAQKAYAQYVKLFGNQQSLERLEERGGFGIGEFCCLYLALNPMGMSKERIERAIVLVSMELKGRWFIRG